METTSKNAATILYTSLKRNPKFERVAGSAWGLSDWYPQKRKPKDETVISVEEDERKSR
jgi:DNA-directed RNA polymerase delta subunit